MLHQLLGYCSSRDIAKIQATTTTIDTSSNVHIFVKMYIIIAAARFAILFADTTYTSERSSICATLTKKQPRKNQTTARASEWRISNIYFFLIKLISSLLFAYNKTKCSLRKLKLANKSALKVKPHISILHQIQCVLHGNNQFH